MTLQDDLAAAKAVLAEADSQQASAIRQLNDARIAYDLATTALTEADAAVLAAETEVNRIEAEIAAQTKSGTVAGMWAQSGGDWKEFQRIEKLLGFPVVLFRSTSGEGQPDNEMLAKGSRDALAAGHMVSLQMQPKTGDHNTRVGIPYKDITAGKHDAFFLSLKGFPQFKALPPRIRQPFEPHSEFNIQKGPRHAQPDVGPASDYADFVIKLDGLARQAGVRDRLAFTPSAAGPQWWLSGAWKQWLTPKLMDSGVIDGLAVDFYAKQKNNLRPPEEGTKGVRQVARSFGIPWSVLETGCEESPGNPNAKKEWFDRWIPLLEKEGHDMAFWTYNVTLSAYRVESSPQAFAAFKALMQAKVWRKP